MTLRPCLDCQELTNLGARCDECRPVVDRQYARTLKRSAHDRGYDSAWNALSRRARRLQPYCLICGDVRDLTADHSPEAWQRREAGKPIRLKDIRVLCRSCNSAAGRARPGGKTLPGAAETPGTEAFFGSHTTPGGYR